LLARDDFHGASVSSAIRPFRLVAAMPRWEKIGPVRRHVACCGSAACYAESLRSCEIIENFDFFRLQVIEKMRSKKGKINNFTADHELSARNWDENWRFCSVRTHNHRFFKEFLFSRELLRLSGKRPNLNALGLFFSPAGWAGKAEPFRTAGGRAAIFSYLVCATRLL
jgi:hypothetical protein